MVRFLPRVSPHSVAISSWILLAAYLWKECSTLNNNAASARTKFLPSTHLHLYPTPNAISSDVTNKLFFQDDEDDAEDVDMYDGQYYDGEYDLDLFEEDKKKSLSKTKKNTKRVSNDVVNANLRRWFQNRNRRQPILFGDLLEEHEKSLKKSGVVKNPPLVPVDDYEWFEPTLVEIERKYDKRKEQLLLSLNTDRKATPKTVPIHANEILQQLLEDEMKCEIKSKLKKMREERSKSTQDDFTEEEYSLKKAPIPHDDKILGQRKDTSKKKRGPIESEIVEMRAQFEKMREDGVFKLKNYQDWKKYQEIKAEEKECMSVESVDEAVVFAKFLNWKEFTMRQNQRMEDFLQNETKSEEKLKVDQHPLQQQKQNFSTVVAEINRKALKALEDILETREGLDTAALESSIEKLRSSLEAVNYVDIKPRETNMTEVFNDEPVNFTEIFPVQAARMKESREKGLKTTDRDEASSRSLRQDFADVEKLLRKDILSDNTPKSRTARNTKSLSHNTPSSSDDEEDIVQAKPNTPFFSDDIVHVSESSKSPHLNNKEKDVVLQTEPFVPLEPKTPFFSENVTDEVEGKYDDDNEKNEKDVISESDINKRPEERITTLLGTFEEQKMKNFYRQGGARTDEQQLKAQEDLKRFQQYQEEKMKQMESLDETTFDLGYNLSDVLNEDGNIDAAKVLAAINEKTNSTSYISRNSSLELTKESIIVSEEKEEEFPNKGITSITSGNVTSENLSDKPEKVLDDDDFKDLNGDSDINLPPEKRSTSLLGTYEEQKMKNVFRQNGIDSDVEKDTFQEQYSTFLRYQEERLKQLEEEDSNDDYDVESMLTDDGNDVDMEKILSAIDQKLLNTTQKASSKIFDKTNLTGVTDKLSEKGDHIPGVETLNEVSEAPQGETVLDSPRYDNEQLDSRHSSLKLEDAPKGIEENSNSDPARKEKKEEQAEIERTEEKFFESLKQMRSEIADENLSSRGSFLGQEELGLAGEEKIEDYDANKRRVEEALGLKSVGEGIDIYEVLGRRPGEYYDDDYDDYTREEHFTRDSNVDLSDYQARKENLLASKNLNLFEVETLMDLKDSIEMHGVSPYIAKIRKPFSEFGAIFRLEGVMVDISKLEGRAWRRVAEEIEMKIPSNEDIRDASVQTPEYAVKRIFSWTSDYARCLEIARIHDKYLKDEVVTVLDSKSPNPNEDLASAQRMYVTLIDGVKSWIKALNDVEMPCGLISYLDEEIVALILEASGLSDFFPPDRRATSNSGFDRDSQLQLIGSLLIDRHPNMCILFDGNAESLSVARENEMKSVGITSIYPSYQLLAADTTARDFEYLTAMNIRRLFSERENQEPMLQTFVRQPSRPKRKVKTMYPENYGNKEEKTDDGHYFDDYDNDPHYVDEDLSPKFTDIPDDGVIFDGDNDSDLLQ